MRCVHRGALSVSWSWVVFLGPCSPPSSGGLWRRRVGRAGRLWTWRAGLSTSFQHLRCPVPLQWSTLRCGWRCRLGRQRTPQPRSRRKGVDSRTTSTVTLCPFTRVRVWFTFEGGTSRAVRQCLRVCVLASEEGFMETFLGEVCAGPVDWCQTWRHRRRRCSPRCRSRVARRERAPSSAARRRRRCAAR